MGYVKKKHKVVILMAIAIACIIAYSFIRKNISIDFDVSATVNSKADFLPLNFTSIEYILNSNICLYKKPRIIILITSHIQNESARMIIRRSYPRDLFHHYNAQIVFLLAEQGNLSQISVNREFYQFNDIIQGNFAEAYRNLTYKHLMGLKWSQDYCSSVKYVIKMDDDIIINYYVLFNLINRFKSTFQLMGHVIENMRPIRDISNKWYVSEQEYAESEYPAFVSGWIYIANSRAVQLILQQAYKANFFWIDDVFVTGILRELADVKLTDVKTYFRYEPKIVECCIKNKYSCNFIAVPSGKDYGLNKNLNDHLWECRYKKTCILKKNIKISCLLTNDFIPTKGYYSPSFKKI